jgi:hypothetical protein
MWISDDAILTICKCSINPITNPNPVYSHLSRDCMWFPFLYVLLPCPSHPPLLDDYNIRRGVKSRNSIIMQYPYVFSSLLIPNFLLGTLSLCSSIYATDQVANPFKATGKLLHCYSLVITFYDNRTKGSEFNGSKQSPNSVCSYSLCECDFNLLVSFQNILNAQILYIYIRKLSL